MKDLRPGALTSGVMKVFERVVLLQLQNLVARFMDLLQSAYSKNRSVDDAILHILDQIYSHLDKPDTSFRLMLFDFSGALTLFSPIY